MKVIHVIPSLAKGGAERLVLDICNELHTLNNVEYVLISFRPENAYEFLTERINWKVISATVIPAMKSKNTVEVDDLQDFIDDFQPDVIHSHLFESEVVLSQIQTNGLRVVHFHDNMLQMKRFGFEKKMNKQTIANLYERKIVLNSLKSNRTIAVAISQNSFDYVTKNLPSFIEKKLLLNAVNTKRFHSKIETKESVRLVIVGSLIPRKNQQLAIEVISELKQRGSSVFLDILGDGIERKNLENLISTLALEDQVIIHGNVDHPENFMKDASIYIHTALSESFGLVLVEAMAAGLPVVCLDGGGNRDLIIDGENGFIVGEASKVKIADKIEFLIKNEPIRLQMAENAQHFSKHFDISDYVKKLIAIYHS